LVGIALILGVFTGIAAFSGSFMSVNYLLAGTVSTNPILFALATWLVLAWKTAGWWGLDRWVLPALGTPWAPGPVLSNRGERHRGLASPLSPDPGGQP
jgi:thiosulfate dehydrogenase [quinone] large subunit